MPFIHKIPKCPRCGGISTGRYVITEQGSETGYLRHGEIIRACTKIPSNNLFCTECGFEWFGEAKFTHISKKELKYIQYLLSADERTILHKEREILEKNEIVSKKSKILGFAGKIFTKMLSIFIIVPYQMLTRDIINLFKGDGSRRKGF